MPSWKAWVQRPSGLNNSKHFYLRKSRDIGIEANISNQSYIVIVYLDVFIALRNCSEAVFLVVCDPSMNEL